MRILNMVKNWLTEVSQPHIFGSHFSAPVYLKLNEQTALSRSLMLKDRILKYKVRKW